MKRDRQNVPDIVPTALDYWSRDGHRWAMPNNWSPQAIYFNRALFDKHGLKSPDQWEREGKWSWDGFVSTLRRLTRGDPGGPDRTIGSQSHSMNLDWACAWIWRQGGDVFSKDLKRCVLNEPAAVEAVQGVADLYLKYQVINYGPHTRDFPDGFYSGRVGLRNANKEATSPERNDLARAQFTLGMVPVYKGKAGRINRMGPLAFGAVQGGPGGAEAGWRWVRFMAGPQAAAILMRRRSTLPIRPRFAQLSEYAQSMDLWESKEVWLESITRVLQQPASYFEIDTLWRQAWQDILAQKAPVKALLDDLVRQANDLLAREPA